MFCTDGRHRADVPADARARAVDQQRRVRRREPALAAAPSLADYLAGQIRAGAQAVQLFDSWVGTLAPDDYRAFVLPHTRAIFDRLRPLGVPMIHFGVGTAMLLELQREAGGDVIGLDWTMPLDAGWARVSDRAVQGNLDPVALFAPLAELKRRVHDVLDRAAGRPGHIFNLGHGILPHTPVEHVRAVVDMVHEATAGRAPGRSACS